MSENDNLKEFARRVIKQMWDNLDVDGGDVQSWAEELGLIKSRIATKEDETDYSDFCAGDEIFEFSDVLRVNA